VVTWAEFARQVPDLADRGRVLIEDHGVAFLATVRKDGSPRLHPITPVFAGDGIYVAVAHRSPKRFDLLRDRRFALHALLGRKDEEFVLTGAVEQLEDGAERAGVVASANHVIRDSDLVFEFLIASALWGYWENTGQPDTYPVHRSWVHTPEDEDGTN
jgi:hypothetical protein